jgi:hypothetical protein
MSPGWLQRTVTAAWVAWRPLTFRWSCQASGRMAPARSARWRFIILRLQLNFGVSLAAERRMMKIESAAALVLLIAVGCHAAAPPGAVASADASVLQVVLSDWQEGPTDGRICLDPLVLLPEVTQSSRRPRWSDSVLRVLLHDTLVAIDTSAAAVRLAGARDCASTRAHPRIALGVPHVRNDSVDVESEAIVADDSTSRGGRLRVSTVLSRMKSRWVIVRRGTPTIQSVPPAR